MELNFDTLTNKNNIKLYLPENLRYLRKQVAKIDQGNFAEKVGLKKTTYNNYETGHSNPSFMDLKLLSALYGLSVDELLYEDVSKVKITSSTNEKEVIKTVEINADGIMSLLETIRDEQKEIAFNLKQIQVPSSLSATKQQGEPRNSDAEEEVAKVRAKIASGQMGIRNAPAKRKVSEKK